MEKKYSPTCEKHSGSENTTLCRTCDCLLCFECTMDHYTAYPDHMTISLTDFAISTIKFLEKDKAKYGSCDALQQEFSAINASLSNKISAAKVCASKFHACVEAALDGYIKSQLALASQLTAHAEKLNDKITTISRHADSIVKNIALVKKLCSERKLSELINLHETVSKPQAEPVSLEAENEAFAKEVAQIQVESFEKFQEELSAQISATFAKFAFVHQGCSMCKKPIPKGIEVKNCAVHGLIICSECEAVCETCHKCVCKGCLQKGCDKKCDSSTRCKNCMVRCSKCKMVVNCEKCELICQKCNICKKCSIICGKCEQKVCEQCHKNCPGKYTWYNKSDTFIKNKGKTMFISTNTKLPKAFKAVIQVTNCEECDWSIGITGKKFSGVDDQYNKLRNDTVVGNVPRLERKEYGWAACKCSTTALNGETYNKYGKPVPNGNMTLILDKTRNLSGEIDDVAQGIIATNIPDGDYYLSFGGNSGASGQVKIISIEELK
eukprot:TRINITY_DN4171_c0_g1_i1.p1 TRINITY_DN4171_c0_g1~~TRINITY_DN4171_c0_g1_i1.p1  ORF type:complete len:535 (+),score=30.95 TRINITY_DN4171_c0_g1_i1:123-1607(+)